MSRLDYRFKEVTLDPALIDQLFHVPAWDEAALEKRHRIERDTYREKKMREVRRAMTRHLTPRQKECLTLHYLKGYSQREIADRLKIHQTTVSQHIRYAINKLRQGYASR
jgi:RNA polymerase sigma factor (sigma-70 family)